MAGLEDIVRSFSKLCCTFPKKNQNEDSAQFLVLLADNMQACASASYDWLVDMRCGMLLRGATETMLTKIRQEWDKCSSNIMRYICDGYGIFWKRRVLHNKYTDTFTNVRYADLLYRIRLQCICNAHLGLPFNPEHAVSIRNHGNEFSTKTIPLSNVCAQDIEYVRKYELLRSTQPIAYYSVREVLDAVMQMDAVWLRLRWDEQLLLYLELLEARIAEITLVPHPDITHDIEVYRAKTNQVVLLDDGTESVLYTATPEFVTMISMYVINFHRAISEYHSIESAPLEDIHAELATKCGLDESDLYVVTTRIKANVKELSDRLLIQFAEEWVSTNYQTLMCRPSELERYKIGLNSKKVGVSSAEKSDAILNFTRGIEAANAVITASQRNMNKYLDTPETECPISLPIAVIRLMSKILLGRAGVNFGDFVYYRGYIHNTFDRQYDNLDEILNNRNPLILQTFNYFHLYYLRKQYACTDFYQLVTYWVAIAVHFRECSLDDKDIEPAMQYLVGENWRSLLKYTYKKNLFLQMGSTNHHLRQQHG